MLLCFKNKREPGLSNDDGTEKRKGSYINSNCNQPYQGTFVEWDIDEIRVRTVRLELC